MELRIRRLGFESLRARPSSAALLNATQVSRSPGLLRAGCRPRAEQHVSSAYQRVGPFRFLSQPLLKGIHADRR